MSVSLTGTSLCLLCCAFQGSIAPARCLHAWGVYFKGVFVSGSLSDVCGVACWPLSLCSCGVMSCVLSKAALSIKLRERENVGGE